MAVCQSKILFQEPQESAPSAENDCILQVVYGAFVVCFLHLRISLISQLAYLIDSPLVAFQPLNAQHESLGFNWIRPSECTCNGISRFGILRVEGDSPPPSNDCLRFSVLLFQYLAELIECRCLVWTQSEVTLEQIPLHHHVTFITFQCGPVIEGLGILRRNVQGLAKLGPRFFMLSKIA